MVAPAKTEKKVKELPYNTNRFSNAVEVRTLDKSWTDAKKARVMKALDRIYSEYRIEKLRALALAGANRKDSAEEGSYSRGIITLRSNQRDIEGAAAHEAMHRILDKTPLTGQERLDVLSAYNSYSKKYPRMYSSTNVDEFVCETFRKMITKKTLHTNEEKVTAQVIDRVFKKKK